MSESYQLPSSLSHLAGEEHAMHDEALHLAGENKELAAHLETIAIAMNAAWHAGKAPSRTENEHTTQMLCFRVFNHMAASLRMVLSGYYQASLLVQRDLYETGWLVAYLISHPEKIDAWRAGHSSPRDNEFSPANVRKALSKFDGLPKKQRDLHYWTLCDYAAHPNAKGFVLLCPPGNEGPQCGPFMTADSLQYSLEELARACCIAAISIGALCENTPDTARVLRKLFVATSQWNAQFMDQPFTQERRDQIDALFGTA